MAYDVGWCNIRKLADVWPDLVGKLEQGIPEEDHWNPAVIADLVGDNVGYCAARGVDRFGSIAAQRCKIKVSVRILSIRGTHDSSMKGTYQRFNGTVSERLLCYNSTTVLVYRWLLYIEQAPSARLNFAYVGCSTSHGTNVTAGVNLGLESMALPVWHSCSKMGMLSTTVYVLTMDMFGPIADNAGGMVQMRQQPKSGREFSDILDAVGNTTKANLLHLHLFFFSMRVWMK